MSIREERLQAGLTQQQMSDMFEIPKRTIEDWEGGKHKCPHYVEKLIVDKLRNLKNEMTIRVNNLDYVIEETDTNWILKNVTGKLTSTFVVDKSDAATVEELIEYVRCNHND